MRKQSRLLWLSLCLSSLVFTVSLVAENSARASATPNGAIAQANPCAAKNPCASQAENVGGPLAQELQGKPVVVDIFATWCPGCQNIAPTLSQLKQEYAGKANFVVLDVSDKAKLKETEARAEKLGLSKFLEANKSKTSTVAIVDPATGNILTTFKNNPNKADYATVLNNAIAQK